MIYLNYLLNLLLPVVCAGCGLYPGRFICPACLEALPRVKGPRCLRCGRPTQYSVDSCNECRAVVKSLDQTVVLGLYQEPLRGIIHELKYSGVAELARPLGSMLAAEVAPRLKEGNYWVTHVPAHSSRTRERGYDQAELLARQLSVCLGLPFFPVLRRSKRTVPQVGLGPEERRRNLRGAFQVEERCLTKWVPGASILLVDDVFTTGATLSEAATLLKRRGAGSVIACVLARDLPAGS